MNGKIVRMGLLALVSLFFVVLCSLPARADLPSKSIEGGITVQFKSIIKEGVELYVTYVVVSQNDTKIEVKASESPVFDSAGNKMTKSGNNIWIGNTRIGGSREIIAGVPTKVVLDYTVNSDYKVTKTYPKVIFVINNKTLEFRDVPGSQ